MTSTVREQEPPQASARRQQLSAVLDRLAARVPGLVHAVGLSADGLCLANSAALSFDRADQFSAMVSGLVSVNRSMARLLGTGGVQFSMTTMDEGVVVVVSVVDDDSSLAALARVGCDVAAMAQQLTVIADQIGEAINPDQRPDDRPVG